ncbi:MAG TPA: hypothetical protein VKB59_06590 [Micromonosporaceae bacterium]|nr:hypothetical protein [Micromonosporaceae bacterium]HKE64307.1 hypothetical protein [Micromonosporaceae bacterium]
MIVRMWEVKAHPEWMADALSWVCEVGVPILEDDPQHIESEVFSSADNRIVVISRWRGEPADIPEPPRRLVERPGHAWDFSVVDR